MKYQRFAIKLATGAMSTSEEELDQNRSAHSHPRRSQRRRGFFGAPIIGTGALAWISRPRDHLHDAVFDRKEVFADAAAMGILLIPAAEVRLLGADVIVLNVTAEEIAQLKNFDDLRRLRRSQGILFSLSRRIRSTFLAAQSDRDCSQRSIVLTRLSSVIFTLAHSIRIAGHNESQPSLANH
jgi:hypothetical protein